MNKTSQTPPPPVAQGEVVDLIQVFRKVMEVVQRNLKILWLFIVVGAILGSIGYFTFKPVYTTQLILEVDQVDYAEVAALVETLNELAKEGNTPAVAQKLRVSENLAQEIRSLKAINITEKETGVVERQDMEEKTLIIEAKVHSNQNLDSLEIGLLHYFESNEYIQRRLEDFKQQKQALIDHIDQEIKQMDSLKRAMILLPSQSQSDNIYLADIGDMYAESVDLYQKKLDLETTLKFSQEFQVVEHFTVFNKPTSFNLSKSIALGAILGGLLWIMAVVLIELRRLIQTA